MQQMPFIKNGMQEQPVWDKPVFLWNAGYSLDESELA